MAKVKITHKVSGVISSVSQTEAKALKANPRFSKIYLFEEPAKDPTEVKAPKVKTPRPETTLGDPNE